MTKRKKDTIPKEKGRKFYVLYKGDNVVSCGTIQEIHDKTQITIDHLVWLTYPVAARREAKGSGKRMIMVEG